MYATTRVTDAIARLKSAFLESPQLQLSLADAERLCNLEPSTCRLILEALEEVRFLEQRNGLFTRRSDRAPGARSDQIAQR